MPACCFILLLLLIPAAPVTAREWTLTPADSIQANITLAADGDTLTLSPGTYSQTAIIVSKNITLRANISHGGTAANTIIDGRGQDRIVISPAAASSITLDHLTLRNGYTDSSGGGLYANGSVTVVSSVFSNCSAATNTSAGGAIASGGPVTVTSSAFRNCSSAGDSGAISVINNTLSVTSSTFSNCSARGDGGSIKVINGSVSVASSAFSNSTTHGDGGTIKVIFGNLAVTSSTFTNSSAINADGGAIKVIFGDMDVTSSTFSDCYARADGGAVKVIIGNLTVTSSSFSRCSAHSDGGAIKEIIGNLVLTSSTFSHCTARSNGGAISAYVGDLAATSVTITNCSSANGDGGALFSDTGAITISSSTIVNSSAHNGSVISANTGTIRYSRVLRDNTSTVVSSSGSTIDASQNWWGTNGDPAPFVNGSVTTAPWLVLGTTASPASASTGQQVRIRANLTFASDGSDTSGGGHIPDGTPVRFAITRGTGSLSATANVTTAGSAETTFVPAGGGNATVNATIDGVSAGVAIPVAGPNPPVTPTPAPTILPVPGSDDSGGAAAGPASPASAATAGVNVGGNSAVTSVAVTGTGLKDIVVTGMVQPGPGSAPPAPGTVYQYLSLAPAGYTSVAGAVISFTLPAAWLEEHHVPPANIVLYRLVNNRWTALPTTAGARSNGWVAYSAASPGFSLFAISGTTGSTPVAGPGAVATGTLAGTSGEPPATGAPVSAREQGTAAPVPPAGQAPAIPVPALAGAGIIVLIAAAVILVRRWWIHRQNPDLFAGDD